MTWAYINAEQTVVSRTNDNGSVESCLVAAISDWIAAGNEPDPYVEPPAPPKTVFAPREYLKKFTMAEYAAARTHSNIGVQWALDNLIGAQFVDITDPDTIAGLDLMVAEGVITPERRDEILTPQAA